MHKLQNIKTCRDQCSLIKNKYTVFLNSGKRILNTFEEKANYHRLYKLTYQRLRSSRSKTAKRFKSRYINERYFKTFFNNTEDCFRDDH